MEKEREGIDQESSVGEQAAIEAAQTNSEQYFELLRKHTDRNEMAALAINDPSERAEFLDLGRKMSQQSLSYEFALREAGISEGDRAFLEEGNHPERYGAFSDAEKVKLEKLRIKLKRALSAFGQMVKLDAGGAYKLPWESEGPFDNKEDKSVPTGTRAAQPKVFRPTNIGQQPEGENFPDEDL